MVKRRSVDFGSGQEAIDEINRLRQEGYVKTGNWNLSQICEHLDETMTGGMDGFGFRLPWVLRATVGKWGFGYALRTRKLMSGAPTFRRLKPDMSREEDSDAPIDSCIETIRRAASFAGPIDDHPLVDNLDVDDWKEFMWIHAAHHLGFLVPKEGSDG